MCRAWYALDPSNYALPRAKVAKNGMRSVRRKIREKLSRCASLLTPPAIEFILLNSFPVSGLLTTGLG